MSRKDEPQVIEEKIIKPNGETQYRRYNKGRLLGKGGFASVYEVIASDTKQLNAAKIMDKNSLTKGRARQKLMNEVKIHKSLNHTNIVKFEHFFEDNDYVYILLEVCTNQTLSDLLRRRKRLLEIETQCYLLQVVSALKYLHGHRIIHRDIKLGNIFLSDKMEIKMGDFGLATKLEFDGEKKRTICGTPNYIAPEILEGRFGHSYEVDIWSFGVLMYTMIIGKPPFETSDVKATYRRIRMNAYSFPDHVAISPESRDLIEKILVTDPASRLSLSEIEEHPFFLKNLIPKLLPTSSLAIPPTSKYLRQFEKGSNSRPLSRGRDLSATKTPRSNSNKEHDRSSAKKDENRGTSRERASSRERNHSGSGSATKKNATTSMYTLVPEGPKIWIKKWVDYSSKYGIGYMLSNGCAGVYFNDSTKIISDREGNSFQYINRLDHSSEEALVEYTFSNFPPDLQKKVTLLMHFRKHLSVDDKVDFVEQPLTIVKKWLCTSHAMIFRLSNKVVQVHFQDKSELMLCSSNKQAVYINKKSEINVYPLATAMESPNKEMSKRLKYTKEILTTMLQNPGGTKNEFKKS
jgi:polo-like kinase 1